MEITNCLNGELKPGDLVLSVPDDDYACLVGTVLSIHKVGAAEHYADNPGDDIHVNFMHDGYSENRLQEIEQMLGDLYGRPTTPGIWPLEIDDLIMAPDALIRITGIGPDLLQSILSSKEAAMALCELVQDGRSVVHTEPFTEKLYSPVNFYLRDRTDAMNGVYDDIAYWRDEISHEDAFGYMAEIKAELAADRQRYDNERGLAEYLNAPLNSKVQSLVPHIELHGDKLWTVADLRLNELLTPDELETLKEDWEGQLSDGWGEGFEQQSIAVNNGDLYVEPWSAERDFFIATQAEFDRRMGISRTAPVQKAVPVAEASPTDNWTSSKQAELFSRLDSNLSDYCESLLDTDKRELIGMAEEIAVRFGVRDYLKNDHRFQEAELDFLLGFNDPLEVVCEHTPPIPMLLDMSGAISELANLDGALRREYLRSEEHTAIFESVDARDAQLGQIARKHCHVETLETRSSDSLDFHDISVWGLKAALEEAYKAGAAYQIAAAEHAQAEVPEPEGPRGRDVLFSRLEQNLSGMMADLRADITAPDLPQKDMMELAERITAVNAAHEYLTGGSYPLDDGQISYLLKLQNPLEMIVNNWPTGLGGLMDMSYLMDDIFDRRDALVGETPPTVKEEPAAPAVGKPSLLAGLREAKIKSDQHKNTPATNKSGPEL